MPKGTMSRSSDSIRDRLEKDILERRYKPGERLPSERETQRREGVGRGTVRAAYRSLQEMGLIHIRHGGGAYVREVDPSLVGGTLSTLIRHRRVSTRHFFEFREAFEGPNVAYAVERATRQEIENLKARVKRLEEHWEAQGATTDFYQMELGLHTELAGMTGNPLFEWIADTYQRSSAPYNKAISDFLGDGVESPEEVLEDWRLLIKALENREVTLAVKIMETHIFRFRQKTSGLETGETETD